MRYIDMHCDTLKYAYENDCNDIMTMPGAQIDVERLKKGGAGAQFFAVFLPPQERSYFSVNDYPGDDKYIAALVETLNNTMKLHPDDIGYAGNYGAYIENKAAGKVSAFLTIEDGRNVLGKMERLDEYYNLGVRLISLTWNAPNCFGFPNSLDQDIMGHGLTVFGKEAVGYMEQKGMLVDVSHLSDGGFYDVADICKGPFVASHSNCRSLSPHQRNMTDDMIRRLGQCGGVMGLNFGGKFLNQDITDHVSRVDRMTAHIQHSINIGGEDCPAIGTDFDGVESEFEINSPVEMEKLFYALKKNGLTENQIEKVAYKNAERVIEAVLK